MASAYHAGVILIHHCMDISFQTDASGSWGVGYSSIQSAWQWHAGWVSVGIMAKGLIPILLIKPCGFESVTLQKEYFLNVTQLWCCTRDDQRRLL